MIDIFLSNFSSKADEVRFSPGVGPNLEIVVNNFCYQALSIFCTIVDGLGV